MNIPPSPLRAPTVHINGTSRDEIVRQLRHNHDTLMAALESLRAATPHGRDYYVQPGQAYVEAQRQHLSRLQRVESVLHEIHQITYIVLGVDNNAESKAAESDGG